MNESNETLAKRSEIPYRRRYVRVAVAAPLTYTIDGRGESGTGSTSDLGGGGIRIATNEDLPLGTVLLLRFSLPSVEREVTVRGRIVLSFYKSEDKKFLHGVAFTQIDPRDQDEIIRYVAAEVQRLAVEEQESASE